MKAIETYAQLEEFGRNRLSANFYMRDFLYSEIAAWHGLRNVPDRPEVAIEVGRKLCSELLEPLQATFGRLQIRSAYRSPTVNDLGNRNNLNCANNEANYAGHIWDYPDAKGKHGATACIVIPWLVDHIESGGKWMDMAWWIHDHLPYSSLCFFSKLAAFNISWHETPSRRIDSYATPKGCLTRPGMLNHGGSHRDNYAGFPSLKIESSGTSVFSCVRLPEYKPSAVPKEGRAPAKLGLSGSNLQANLATVETTCTASSGKIFYRAIHTKSLWRKVNSHRSLESAISGRDGAAGLFARKARIDYQAHGDPLYVVIWEDGAATGVVIKAVLESPDGIRKIDVPTATLWDFERRGHASSMEIEHLFLKRVARELES